MSRKNIDNIFPEKDKTKKLEENKGGGGKGMSKQVAFWFHLNK